MRDPNTYRIHIESTIERRETTEPIDPDLEGYCYSVEHYATWELKQPLRDKLPKQMIGIIDDWAAAAAAVQTSIGRINMLDHEGIDRGWPEKTSSHLSRTTSDLNSMCSPSPPSSAISPPAGSFCSNGDFSLPPPHRAAPPSSLSSAQAVFESPPWTPDDVTSARPPFEPLSSGHTIDPLKLNERLSSYEHQSSAGDASPSTSSACAAFDAPSWERYLDEYKREVEALQKEDLPRVRHLAHKITVDYRLLLEEHVDAIDNLGQELFSIWWSRMSTLQNKLQEDVEQVSMPTLAEIKHVRRVYGLPV